MKKNEFADKQKEVIFRSAEYIEGMRVASRVASQALLESEKILKAGIATIEIDKFIYEFALDHNAYPATLNYRGFPASCCISINEVICHGIPSKDRRLKNGDIVNVDVALKVGNYYGDLSKTYLIGECSESAKHLIRVTKECLNLSIDAVKPYGYIGDIGYTIKNHAENNGCSVVEDFTGHGIGQKMHENLQVPHFGRKNAGKQILPGMFFTIEPMINLGQKDMKMLSDKWTAVTADNSLSAQFEHTIFVTDSGVEVLTYHSDYLTII